MTTSNNRHSELYLYDMWTVLHDLGWGGVGWEESCMRPHRSYSSGGHHQEREERSRERRLERGLLCLADVPQ